MFFCCAYGIYIIPPFTAVQPERHHSVTEHEVYIHQYLLYTNPRGLFSVRELFVVVFFSIHLYDNSLHWVWPFVISGVRTLRCQSVTWLSYILQASWKYFSQVIQNLAVRHVSGPAPRSQMGLMLDSIRPWTDKYAKQVVMISVMQTDEINVSSDDNTMSFSDRKFCHRLLK